MPAEIPDKYLPLLKLLSGGDGSNESNQDEKIKKAISYLNDKLVDTQQTFLTAIKLLRGNQERQELEIKELSTRLENPAYNDSYTSKTRMRDNQTVEGERLSLANIKGRGLINQILCISETNNYSISIFIDENILFNKPYSYFETKSDYLENISAFLDSGRYYLSLRSIRFQKGFRIDINSDGTTVFEQTLVKFIISDGIDV